MQTIKFDCRYPDKNDICVLNEQLTQLTKEHIILDLSDINGGCDDIIGTIITLIEEFNKSGGKLDIRCNDYFRQWIKDIGFDDKINCDIRNI